MPDESTIYWAFLHFFHMDKANACMHMAPVKFSPITFHMLDEVLAEGSDWSSEMAEVKSHRGRYEVDPGR
jgi:hypothetical protein